MMTTGGRRLWAVRDASCLSRRRLPTPPHDETGHTWHHDNPLIFEYTKFGGTLALTARGIPIFESGMPGFGDFLTDQKI